MFYGTKESIIRRKLPKFHGINGSFMWQRKNTHDFRHFWFQMNEHACVACNCAFFSPSAISFGAIPFIVPNACSSFLWQIRARIDEIFLIKWTLWWKWKWEFFIWRQNKQPKVIFLIFFGFYWVSFWLFIVCSMKWYE